MSTTLNQEDLADDLVRRGIETTGEISLRSQSVNETDRSVEAVIATNNPVSVYDWGRGEVVDEILVIDGMRDVSQVPFLDNHDRSSNDHVIGSVRSIRRSSSQVTARLHFADLGEHDEVGQRINRYWHKVKTGHQREVSAGYRSHASVYISAGREETVGGVKYRAGRRTLKVTTEWELKEVSLVPIGADSLATVRSKVGEGDMSIAGQGRAPAIHSTGQSRTLTQDALICGLLIRAGIPLDHEAFSSLRWRGAKLPDILKRDINDPSRQKAMDDGHLFASSSMFDTARRVLALRSGYVDYHEKPDDVVQRAFSSAEFSVVFTNAISAQILAGYVEAGDTTDEWTSEAGAPNFLDLERNSMGKMGPLKKLHPGGTAQHMTNDATQETYRIFRYAGQFVMDEIDLINDSSGQLNTLSPREMGAAAREIRPNLVYAILLANSDLQDGTALFHADHGNLLPSSTLSESMIETALSTMGSQRINGRTINVRGRYVIVPPTLYFAAERYVKSGTRESSSGTDNPLKRQRLMVLDEDRISSSGVTDPDTETAVLGSDSSWYVAAKPGEGGAKTIEVSYLRSSGKAPRIRPMPLTNGRWGMAWDVNLDIGAKALDFRGLLRADA